VRTRRWKNRRGREREMHFVFASRTFSKAPHDGNLVENFCLLYTGLGFVTQSFALFKRFLTFLTQNRPFHADNVYIYIHVHDIMYYHASQSYNDLLLIVFRANFKCRYQADAFGFFLFYTIRLANLVLHNLLICRYIKVGISGDLTQP